MKEPTRILLVDDDEGARRTLTLILERKGYVVETAATVQEALAVADSRFFNLGLIDVRLPDGTGIELLSPLKARHPDMELIVVTGYASTETAVRALNEGAAAYVTKPLKMEQVLAEVSKALEKQRLVVGKRQAEEQIQHLNAVLDGVRTVNRLIAREPDRQHLISQVCRSLVETRGYLGAWLALQNERGEVTGFASAGDHAHTLDAREMLGRSEWPPCARRALDQSDVVVVGQPDCDRCPRARADAAGSFHRGLAAPLAHAEKVYGVLVVAADVDFVPEQELSLFGELAADVALALHSIELEEQGHRATRALRVSEERYRILFEGAPVALWEEDLSALKKHLDQLRRDGLEDFESHFQAQPESVVECLSLVRVLDVNQAAVRLYQAASKEQLISNLDAVFTERSYETFAEELAIIAAGKP
ncbi:MAG: response regulator, partial [Chloroflexota bacterium]